MPCPWGVVALTANFLVSAPAWSLGRSVLTMGPGMCSTGMWQANKQEVSAGLCAGASAALALGVLTSCSELHHCLFLGFH